MSQQPPSLPKNIYSETRYLLFDGTYFHKDGCLVNFVNVLTKKSIAYEYIDKESYYNILPMLIKLKSQGLNPKTITLDGHRKVIEAILEIWPAMIIQRCLFHIQNQGLMWLRTYPKTQAGRELRDLLSSLTSIRTKQEMKIFILTYQRWRYKHQTFIKQLPRHSVANIDLKRTVGLISNALPNMFHFLKDRNIASTTNFLENFYSQLKHQYQRHRGLTETHKIAYLKWFCYLKTI